MIIKQNLKKALTIAGSDSSGGAGIQADLKTFSAFGVYGMTVITAITAQNTLRVHGIEGISSQLISLQFEAVLTDIGIDGIKTGMLFKEEIVHLVAQKIKESGLSTVVVDPVLAAKGGDQLLEFGGIETLKKELIPLAMLVTPNIPEAEILSNTKIKTIGDLHKAASIIKNMGCGGVLIKGGHLKGDAVDFLFDGETCIQFKAERIDTQNTHGTGCTYSSAILANLIKGLSLESAIDISKRYVTDAIRNGLPLGKGHGPLYHHVQLTEVTQ